MRIGSAIRVRQVKWAGLICAALGMLGCTEPRWGPGAVSSDPPRQGPTDRRAWTHGAWRLDALADFEVRAQILGVKHYRSGNTGDLAPVDVALGWGRMSDETVLDHLTIRQSGRWYHYRWKGPVPPIPLGEIVQSSSNMHLIPASSSIRHALKKLREGDVVTLQGVLVEARGVGGSRWRSSMSRSDAGGGACELVWVESVTVETTPVD